MFSLNNIVKIVASVALVMVAAILHECAHGWVAYKCGDNTAKDAGRLTLNPAAHLDPFGSVILPLIMAVAGGPVFAFAKPVPYNPNNLRHPRRDELLVALAGPASNMLQALAGAALFNLLIGSYVGDAGVLYWVLYLTSAYIYVNLVLMFFNLIPLPPLDGSSIIGVFLSGHALQTYYKVQNYSMPILLIVLYLIPMVFNVDPLGSYLNLTAGGLYDVLLGA
jgi:Zn-dependent protease